MARCKTVCHKVPKGCHKGKARGGATRKRGYKKCIVNALKGTKFHTPLQARKAYAKAAKKCRKLTAGKAIRRRKHKRGGRRRRGVSWQMRKREFSMLPGSVGAFLG